MKEIIYVITGAATGILSLVAVLALIMMSALATKHPRAALRMSTFARVILLTAIATAVTFAFTYPMLHPVVSWSAITFGCGAFAGWSVRFVRTDLSQATVA